ncbi:MAG: chemotaxis protein CheX [Deltaproteobacteria bacterium]|nr:chemotaxis protein CheX [Deltaproteobacteria bacterium]
MENLKKTQLQSELASLISRFAFVISEPLEDPGALPPGVNIIQVDYTGERGGSIFVVTDNELGQKLLSNLIDLETATDADIVDALCELGNVFAGNILTFLFGSKQTYSLKPPKWFAMKSKDLTELDEFVFLDCEGSLLGVRVSETN